MSQTSPENSSSRKNSVRNFFAALNRPRKKTGDGTTSNSDGECPTPKTLKEQNLVSHDALVPLSEEVVPTPIDSKKKIMQEIRTNVGTLVSKIGFSLSNILLGEPESVATPERKVRGGVLLHGCATPEEHWEKHDGVLKRLFELNGKEGLLEAGLTSRLLPCEKHRSIEQEEEKDEEPTNASDAPEQDESDVSEISAVDGPPAQEQHVFCEDCLTRLFHIETNTPVTAENRKQFIADGRMYDEISRCCQDIAHDRAVREGDLEWINIVPADEKHPAIRALVSKGYRELPTKPILLLVTGKGMVQAGIFSRQHMLTTGFEPSSAIYQIMEAKKRGWSVVLLDPNARGEKMAMLTIEQSMASIFDFVERQESTICKVPLYIQAHSASGAHVVRYLMDKGHLYLHHIRGVVFTDSTHNIQWCRTKDLPHLMNFLESPACIYFRSSNPSRDKGWEDHSPGQDCTVSDEYWVRRFGKVQTYWAGTTEHSLSDWHARHFIWNHFDSRSQCQPESEVFK
jgi:hypothetical protein